MKLDASIAALYDLFTPFFFIGVGLHLNPESLGSAWLPAGVLLAAAVLGKLAGAGLPAWLTLGTAGGILVGVSMLPRAEIFMVVMQRGLRLGEWAVSASRGITQHNGFAWASATTERGFIRNAAPPRRRVTATDLACSVFVNKCAPLAGISRSSPIPAKDPSSGFASRESRPGPLAEGAVMGQPETDTG